MRKRYQLWEYSGAILLIIMLFLLVVCFFIGFMDTIHPTERYVQETQYQTVYIDAPMGRFYGDVEGGFFIGSVGTNPSEAYTVKYIENGEIKTKIFDSQDESCHVIPSNHTGFVKSYSFRHGFTGDEIYRVNNYYLYVNCVEGRI